MYQKRVGFSLLALGFVVFFMSPLVQNTSFIQTADAAGKSVQQRQQRVAIRLEKKAARRAARERSLINRTVPISTTLPPASGTENHLDITQQVATSFFEVFNGYGTTVADVNTQSVHLRPMASTTAGETHAGLVRTGEWMTGDYQISTTITTNEQLRTGFAPNPWEVAWLPFGYNEDGTFKYLIFKPNGYGVELGESLGNNAQNFLWTSAVGALDFPIQTSYDVRVEVRGQVISVFVNGASVLTYLQNARDHLDTDGYVGFYSEDADVSFTKISITSL
ncbi:TPA: hypothetical protein DEB00_00165 [Candidatus Uhrbacteria bacterium]|nr:hypothetical protein [Candidatus Uhrbacteria bacterium]